MTLHRFKDMDEARRSLWIPRGDPSLATRIRALWAFARRLAPGSAPRGLRRFRTIAEANRDRELWCARRAEQLRALRRRT